jgi:O-antigen ligase
VAFSANRPVNIRLLAPLAAISLVMALGVLESKALGILGFDAIPILALCVLPCLTVFFCTRPLQLTLLWLAVLLYEEIAHDALFIYPSLAQLGTVQLEPMDIPYFLTGTYLLTTAAMRPHEIKRVIKDYPFLVLFIITVIGSVVIYTPEYGKMAIGEARRSFFYFFFPVLTVISVKTFADLHRLLLAVFFLAVGVSVLGYLLLFMGPSIVRSSLRPISANGALILLFTILSVLIAHTNNLVIASKTIDSVMIGLFLPLVIISHHRTVFLAATLSLCILFGLHRRKVLFVIKASATLVILLALICVAFIMVPRFENIFMKALAGMADPHSDATASWRMEGWQKQLTALSERQVFLGQGLGSYYNWDMGNWQYSNEKIKVGPHNAYVEIVLKLGLVGLAVYVLLAFSFFRRMLVARKKLLPGPARAYVEMSLVTFAAAHACMSGYGFSLIIFIFYAIGITAFRLLQDGREVTAQREEVSRENFARYFVSQST